MKRRHTLTTTFIFLLCSSLAGCALSEKPAQPASASRDPAQPLSAIAEGDTKTGLSSSEIPLEGEFIAPDGETLSFEEADLICFPCAYITYCEAGESWNPESVPLKVREGDVLDNGLEVIRAYTSVSIRDGKYELAETEASFNGEFTMIGTLRCDQEADPIDGKVGDLYFVPDADQDVMLPFQLYNSGRYKLGNIHDDELPEGITEIVNDDGKETARVEATIRYIRVFSTFVSSGKRDTATLVSVKQI